MNSYLSLSIFFHLLNKNINNSYLISLFWELNKIMYIKRSTELNQLLGSICYYYVRYFFPSVWSEIWGDKKQRKTKQNFSPPQNCLLTASERADIATAVWAMLKEAELSLSRVTLFELFLFLPFPLWSKHSWEKKKGSCLMEYWDGHGSHLRPETAPSLCNDGPLSLTSEPKGKHANRQRIISFQNHIYASFNFKFNISFVDMILCTI